MPTRLDFDEIRAMARAVYAEVENESLEVQRKRMCDWFDEMLIDAYIAGLQSTGLPIDPVFYPQEADRILHKEIDGKTYTDRLITHLENGDIGRIENLAESESHRVSEAGAYETANQYQDGVGNVEKVWSTMEDNRVRDTHDFLDGVGVPLNTLFFTFDGDSARYPGDFYLAENNTNCRCWLRYRIR